MCVGPMLLRLAIDLGRRCRKENESRKYVYHVQTSVPRAPTFLARCIRAVGLPLFSWSWWIPLSCQKPRSPGLACLGGRRRENSLRDFMWSRGQ
jgi:hypothetical protein